MRPTRWGLALASALITTGWAATAQAAPPPTPAPTAPVPTSPAPRASAPSSAPATPPPSGAPTAAPTSAPASGADGTLGAGVEPASPHISAGGDLNQATQQGLGYGADEFQRRGAQAAVAAQVEKKLRNDPGFSYAYQRSDGATVVVGQGKNVTDEAAAVGAVVDQQAFDPQLPTIASLQTQLQQQVGLYGVGAIGYGASGYVVTVDPAAKPAAGKKSPEEFAKQFKHLTIKREALATKGSSTARGGDNYNINNTYCSLGFNGYYNGAPAILTAGHCTGGGTGSAAVGPSGTLGTVSWSMWGGGQRGTDLATITNLNTGAYDFPPEVNAYTGGIVTITGVADAVPGMPVCKAGRTTGWTCGNVDFLGWIWVAEGSLSNGSWVWSGASQSVVVNYGDSGGAWVSGHKAVGITSALYDSISLPSPAYRSTFALATDAPVYHPGTEIAVFLGTTTTFNGVDSSVPHNLTQGSVVTGRMPTVAGDSWSPGTQMHIWGVGTDGRVPVNPDGTFTFTYTGPSGQPTLSAQAEYGSSRGGVFTVNGGAQIIPAYAAQTQSASKLGAATGGVVCGLDQGGCFQPYQNGAVYWTLNTGVYWIRGGIFAEYSAVGREHSFLGYPTSVETCNDPSGANPSNVGCWQRFQHGYILWSPATGARTQPDSGAIRTLFGQQGYERGPLGFPTTDQSCGLVGGGCFQFFEGGGIYWSDATGVQIVHGAILSAWAGQGYERSSLGYPIGPETCNDPSGANSGNVGCWQRFQHGFILWSPATGVHIQPDFGAIRNLYGQLGYERGPLGFPTTDQTCGIAGGGCFQFFEGGGIYWSDATGVQMVHGAILSAWAGQGYEAGALGYPIGPENCNDPSGRTPGNVGCWQRFQHGFILWSPATGVHIQPDTGPIRDTYAARGYERGVLGFPTSDQSCTTSGCTQSFEGGTITWDRGSNQTTVALKP